MNNEQTELYTKMQGFKLTEGVKAGYDYFLLDTIKGIEYYTPNDETWGAIIAVSDEHKLAHYTGFYEMDDMAAKHGEYTYHVYKHEDGDLMMACAFEIPEDAPRLNTEQAATIQKEIITLLECLLDTAQRTTDLENIYCDINDSCVSNERALAIYTELCQEAKHTPLSFTLHTTWAHGCKTDKDGNYVLTRDETIKKIKSKGLEPQSFFDIDGNKSEYVEAIVLNWMGE